MALLRKVSSKCKYYYSNCFVVDLMLLKLKCVIKIFFENVFVTVCVEFVSAGQWKLNIDCQLYGVFSEVIIPKIQKYNYFL